MDIKNNSYIMIIGGDLRQTYLYNKLKNTYPNVLCAIIPDIDEKLPDKNQLKLCNTILLPIPFSKDKQNIYTTTHINYPLNILIENLNPNTTIVGGYFDEKFLKLCKGNNINTIDLKDYEPFEIKNAIATAEGAIARAVIDSPLNIHGSNCLITGYGKCGKAIAARLKAINAKTYVAVRKISQMSSAYEQGHTAICLSDLSKYINQFDFIFNTVPAKIITRELLSKANPFVTIIDIASKPGGTDFDACSEFGIKSDLALSLPGLYSPQSSANIIYECMEEINET